MRRKAETPTEDSGCPEDTLSPVPLSVPLQANEVSAVQGLLVTTQIPEQVN